MLNDSCPLPSGRDCSEESIDWDHFTKVLKQQWKLLWRERIDDKVRAEGIASKDFELLFIKKGMVVIATRDYRPPDFKEIIEKYDVPYEVRIKQRPHPSHGGWRKFIRKEILSKKRNRKQYKVHGNPKRNPQSSTSSRGWLHIRR